jgi:tellurium resistance protein TerD
MAISLQKGGNISLTKTDASLTKMIIGLGWDTRSTDGQSFDLDASAFITNTTGKARSEKDFIFYNNLSSPDGVTHTGDNKTGDGDGDDEQITIDLTKLPAEVQSVFITVTIHEAEARRQNFGQVRNAFARVVNEISNQELVRYDLGEDFSTETAIIFAEIYRHGTEWKFRAIGQGFAGGLSALVHHFGL